MSYLSSLSNKHQKKIEKAIGPIERQTILEVRSYLKELLQDALKVEPNIGCIKLGMGTGVVSGDYTVVYDDGTEFIETGWQYNPKAGQRPKHGAAKKLLDAVEEYVNAVAMGELPESGDIYP